jgi:hypothetical protein
MLRNLFGRRKEAPVVEDVAPPLALAPAPVLSARPHESAPVALEAPPARRDRQKNIKATAACLAVFEALMKAQELGAADLFEDLVAERQAKLMEEGKFRQAAE